MLACYYFLPYCREIVATGKVYQVRRRSGLDTFSWRVCGSCCVQPQPMASDLLLITNQFNKITSSFSLVLSVKMYLCFGHCGMWVSTWRHRQLLCSGSCEKIDCYGGHFTADSRSHGRRVDEGARLSELLVAMIIVAPDGGKWS